MPNVMETSPLLTLWYKPRPTLQGLIETDRGQRMAWVLVALFGSLQTASAMRGREEPGVLFFLAGPAVALLLWVLLAWLLRNFGRWFGAQAEQGHLRLALGWGLLPWLITFALFALALVQVAPEQLAGLFPLFFAGFLYGYVILLLCVQTALRLSFVKSFLCLAVTCLFSFFPLTLIAQLLLGTPPTP